MPFLSNVRSQGLQIINSLQSKLASTIRTTNTLRTIIYSCLPSVTTFTTLQRLITAHYSRFKELQAALTSTVNTVIAPYYEGPLGVDLLLGRHNGEEVINPCVEVNLRMTMGMVTSQLGNRLMHGDRTATFKIGEANTVPPCSLPLTPILPGTRHAAWLEMLEINQKG